MSSGVPTPHTSESGLPPTFYLLLGSPGTGKLTVATALVHRLNVSGRPARLLDNHAATQVLFSLTPAGDGVSLLPASLFDLAREINYLVLRAVDELSPDDWSFVLTHHLPAVPSNERYVAAIADLAARRGAQFVPIVLRCDIDEVVRRVADPSRHGRKLVDPDRARTMAQDTIVEPAGCRDLDITALDADTAAAWIIMHGADS